MFELDQRYVLTLADTRKHSISTVVELDMKVVAVELPFVTFERNGWWTTLDVRSPLFLFGERQVELLSFGGGPASFCQSTASNGANRPSSGYRDQSML